MSPLVLIHIKQGPPNCSPQSRSSAPVKQSHVWWSGDEFLPFCTAASFYLTQRDGPGSCFHSPLPQKAVHPNFQGKWLPSTTLCRVQVRWKEAADWNGKALLLSHHVWDYVVGALQAAIWRPLTLNLTFQNALFSIWAKGFHNKFLHHPGRNFHWFPLILFQGKKTLCQATGVGLGSSPWNSFFFSFLSLCSHSFLSLYFQCFPFLDLLHWGLIQTAAESQNQLQVDFTANCAACPHVNLPFVHRWKVLRELDMVHP